MTNNKRTADCPVCGSPLVGDWCVACAFIGVAERFYEEQYHAPILPLREE